MLIPFRLSLIVEPENRVVNYQRSRSWQGFSDLATGFLVSDPVRAFKLVEKTGNPAVGKRLKSLRESPEKISQDAFAERLGINKNTLGSYERGETYPDLELLIRLKEITGVSLDWLATGCGDRQTATASIDPELFAQFLHEAEQDAPSASRIEQIRVAARAYARLARTEMSDLAAAIRTARGLITPPDR